jgi:FMN-dependent NADH-azoreductase
VFVVMGRGGIYNGDGGQRRRRAKVLIFQEPYLRGVLGCLGLTVMTFIHAAGLNISAEAAEQGCKQARDAIVAGK